MIVTLKYPISIYKEVKGKPVLAKKNCPFQMTLDLDDINVIETVFNEKGNLVTNKCRIHLESVGWQVLDYPHQKLVELKSTPLPPSNIGFKLNSKKIKKK